jgi:two-component system NtrC family sensor kinase
LAVLGRLSSGIAHELGTPLNVVAGRAKLIAAGDLERGEVVASSRVIEEQARRMTGILHQLLDYARRRPSKRSPVNAARLVRHVIDLVSPTARKTGVSLVFRKHRGTPPANADSGQLQQVIMNLVMNAVQSMPDGGEVEIAVDVEAATRPGAKSGTAREHLVVRVRDQGEGIPAENIGLVFDPFFTTKEVGRGTGLGLSVSQGIVEDHGGWILVESEPGRGSCFSVYLPLEEPV